jgi:hypothetical protein
MHWLCGNSVNAESLSELCARPFVRKKQAGGFGAFLLESLEDEN